MARFFSKRKTAENSKAQNQARPHKVTQQSTENGVLANIMFLQRTVGNRAVGQMLQRKTSGADSSTGKSSVPPEVHRVLNNGCSQPLDSAARNFMEARFKRSFGQVRIHTDSQAAASARAVNARAYTVDRKIVFAEGQYAPNTKAGQRLLAHELTHVSQQNEASAGVQRQNKLTLNQPGDAYEQEADAVAERVMTGARAGAALTPSRSMIQRETSGSDPEKKPSEKKGAGAVILEGLTTVAEQAVNENPKVKKVIIEPMTKRLKGKWADFSTGEKAGLIGAGAASLGLTAGPLLSAPVGQKLLEGKDLAMPFTLIPYMPLTSFKYTLPSGGSPETRLFKFETGFKADDLINLRTKSRGLPEMSLRGNIQWGYDPATASLSVLGGDASLGVVPGLTISAGVYKDILRPPKTFIDAEGRMTQTMKSIPEFDKPQPIPDVRVMLNVDLMKFKPSDLEKQIQGIFGD